MAATSSGAPNGASSGARFLLSGATNNPHQSWLGYFGIPEDIAEWTIDDVRSTVASIAPSVLSSAPAAAGANGIAAPPPPESLRRTVTLADFDRYLRTIGEPYRFFAASRPSASNADAGENGNGASGCASRAVPDEGGEAPGGGHLASAAAAERLKAVPPIVFSDHFVLTEPETFRVFSPEGAPAATMVMIEKLANYLDQVELTLLSEVSSRAAGFFEALASYNRLAGEVEAGVLQIASMRSRLRHLEQNLVHRPLVLPRLARRKTNLSSLHDKLRLIRAVVQAQPTISQLLSAADFPGALELIASAQQLLKEELKGVAALTPIGEGMVATKAVIEATMARDLLEIALGYDPDTPPPSFPAEAVASDLTTRLAPLATGLYRLGALAPPLRRLSDALKKDVKAVPKRVLQAQLPKHGAAGAGAGAGVDAAPEDKAKGLLAQLKELDLDAYEDVMGQVGAALMVLLRRAAAVHAALSRALAAAAPPVDHSAPGGTHSHPGESHSHPDETGARSNGTGGRFDEPRADEAWSRADESNSLGNETSSRAYAASLNEETAGLLRALAELAADRFGRYLRARAEAHARMPLAGFGRVCKMAEEFGADVAHLVGEPCHTVTAEVASQASAFIERIHMDASKKIEMVVEQEQWTQVNVPVDFQSIVDSICNNQIPRASAPDVLPLDNAEASSADDPPTTATRTAAAAPTESPAQSPAASPAAEIVLEGAGYKVVGSGLILLSIIAQYLQCGTAMSAAAPKVAHALPALLKLYHTRAYKQVLMAGAMLPTSAGLKSISFKHLALSSQCLGVVLALLPHLKAILTAYLPEAHRPLLQDLDSAASDFEAHQQQIFAKFVSILEERRRGRMEDVAVALTPAPGSARQPEPSPNIKSVATDLRNVHKTLRDLLTRQQLHELFGQILAAYDSGLLETYRGVDTAAAYTRQCIVQDVQHLRKEVAKLHLSLPNGCCPELVAHALALPVA